MTKLHLVAAGCGVTTVPPKFAEVLRHDGQSSLHLDSFRFHSLALDIP